MEETYISSKILRAQGRWDNELTKPSLGIAGRCQVGSLLIGLLRGLFGRGLGFSSFGFPSDSCALAVAVLEIPGRGDRHDGLWFLDDFFSEEDCGCEVASLSLRVFRCRDSVEGWRLLRVIFEDWESEGAGC